MNLFTGDATLEVIGTGASQTGKGEWCVGPAMARELVESDWRYWGDLRLDVAGARIHSRGAVAWLATEATVGEQWRFHQMQFAFPTTRFPDLRQTQETGDVKPLLDD
jgi:hypothetical protein